MKMLARLALVAALVFSGSLASAASLVATSAKGKIEITAKTLAGLPRQSVTATAHDKSATYQGYDLIAVLRAAGLAPTESLRGKQLGELVTISAADGYRVVFSLAELDPMLGNRQVLLVDSENGRPLSAADGPWRLVVPADQRPARWIRQISVINVSQAGP